MRNHCKLFSLWVNCPNWIVNHFRSFSKIWVIHLQICSSSDSKQLTENTRHDCWNPIIIFQVLKDTSYSVILHYWNWIDLNNELLPSRAALQLNWLCFHIWWILKHLLNTFYIDTYWTLIELNRIHFFNCLQLSCFWICLIFDKVSIIDSVY